MLYFQHIKCNYRKWLNCLLVASNGEHPTKIQKLSKISEICQLVSPEIIKKCWLKGKRGSNDKFQT